MAALKRIVFQNQNGRIRPAVVFLAQGVLFLLFFAAIVQILFMVAHAAGFQMPEWAVNILVKIKTLTVQAKS
jgi:hypothetical protein